jgi:hypothetical protein
MPTFQGTRRDSFLAARDCWLSFALPLFSSLLGTSRPQKKTPDTHTSTSLGSCELEIGVSRFSDTSVFEVIYVQNSLPHNDSQSTNTSSQEPITPSTPFIITPAALSQINALASANPRVTDLLLLAHSKEATLEQLRELGNMVNTVVSTSVAARYDLVIEFRERPGYRRIIPKDQAFWEMDGPSDPIVIRTVLKASEAVTMTFRNASAELRLFLTRWVPKEEIEGRRRKWDTIVSACLILRRLDANTNIGQKVWQEK